MAKHVWDVRATLRLCGALLALFAPPFLIEGTTGCGFEVPLAPIYPNSYVCACTCEPSQRRQALRVSATLDDAESGTTDAGDLDLGLSIVGVRFAGLDIPPGAGVLSATVQFTADQAFGGDNTVLTNLDVYGVAADSVPAFGGNFTNLGAVTRTVASAGWPIPSWSLNQSGPGQLTPDLKLIIQEIVNRPGWQSGNALALIFAGSGRREAMAYDGDPARAPVLSVEYLDAVSPAAFNLYTCVPPAYNGNLPDGVMPTDAQLGTDCTDRVQPTLSALNDQCGYPSVCSCSYVPDTLRYAGDKCDAECIANPVDSQCTNFDPKNSHVEANTAGNNPPICTVFSPLAAELFGQRTLCSVEGTSEITVHSGDDSQTENSHTTGVVQFLGTPCSDCPAGMEYILDFGNVKVGNFFKSATFNKLAGVGESMPGYEAVISPSGEGTFGPQALDAAAQGRRDDGELKGLVAANDNAVNVAVGWGQADPNCHVDGALIGGVDPELNRCEDGGPICQSDADCSSQDQTACSDGVCNCLAVESGDLSLNLNVAGDILNQPPKANAGPNQNVECNAAAVTNAILEGSASSDPDGDITLYSWFRGSRVGDEVGTAPIAHVQQTLGTESYVLRVIDSYGQADEDATEIDVIDTTPPVVSCSVIQSVLNQTNHDLVDVGLTGSGQDQCEGTLSVTVNVFADEDEQSTADGTYSPDAKDIGVGTLRLRAERQGSSDGRVYLVIAEATDSSGNRGYDCCTVSVPLSRAPAALPAVQHQAAGAQAFCLGNDGAAPAGYFAIGAGTVIGPKQ